MYFDLFVPFPLLEEAVNDQGGKKKKDKGKGKAVAAKSSERKSCWDGLSSSERDEFARNFALSGHLGYSVIGCTIMQEPSAQAIPSPFSASLPYPHLDPRQHAESSTAQSRRGQTMVQVTRFQMRLDDSKTHCMTSANTNTLRDYDILSVQPTSDKALQLACTDLSMPGPNQLSIITLPLHERPYHFRLNRKQIRQAQRNGVVFELLYSAGLFPPPSVSAETARRYRQNWMSNAREVVRVTGGKGVILSSGPGGSAEGMRGALDVVNLATMLGMPANLAKDAVSLNPKMVLLKAQARRTYKAVFATPRMVMPPADGDTELDVQHVPSKRSAESGLENAEKAEKVARI